MPETTKRSQTAAESAYSEPRRRCDIVMKGGITSGVVYPLAVCELAKEFRFANVGGTSAGAIAAAFTAAAEYRRGRGDSSGFAMLEKLPAWLGATGAPGREGGDRPRHSNLFSLFQPDRATRPLFRLLTAALGPRRGAAKAIEVAAAALAGFPLCLAGALPGVAAGVLALAFASGSSKTQVLASGLALACALVLAVLGLFATLAGSVVLALCRQLPRNFYGLCSGFAGESAQESPRTAAARTPALTAWMATMLNDIAGKPKEEGPLTFGDLRTASASDGEGINLQLMTTSLTQGRPYRLPFENESFLFAPAEMRRLFPGWVVDWMERRSVGNAGMESRAVGDAGALRQPADVRPDGLLPLPAVADFPVVVAARMSLSFPLLISAVPLHAIDWSLVANRAAPGSKEPSRPGPALRSSPRAERCWFSDGGITSNFPMHFFDQPLPLRPSFGINLRPCHPDHPLAPDQPDSGVWMPDRNGSGTLEWWTRFDAGPGWRRLLGFCGALAGTMQNWRDNAHLRVPGYRDRIVHISHSAAEGGLNLDMSAAAIAGLTARGRRAGERLRERFGSRGKSRLSWDNHRWLRYRSTMALVEELLGELHDAYRGSEGGERSYADLIARPRHVAPRSYRWKRREQQAFARAATEELVALAARWRQNGHTFSRGAPRPAPDLRITPRV